MEGGRLGALNAPGEMGSVRRRRSWQQRGPRRPQTPRRITRPRKMDWPACFPRSAQSRPSSRGRRLRHFRNSIRYPVAHRRLSSPSFLRCPQVPRDPSFVADARRTEDYHRLTFPASRGERGPGSDWSLGVCPSAGIGRFDEGRWAAGAGEVLYPRPEAAAQLP